MLNIKEYHRLLREYQIREQDGHLIVPDRCREMTSNIARKLFDALGDLRSDNENFKIRKLSKCKIRDCVSPQCYTFDVKPVIKKSLLSKEDIIDIANDMDLQRIEEIGYVAYLEEYNRNLPEILQVSLQDFRTIYAYMKGNRDVS